MPFLPALSAPQKTTLRGDSTHPPAYAGTMLLSACPNTTVYSARVNQVSFTASFAQVTYDGGSGTLANVLPGMTVLISHTNNRAAAFFVGRVRKTPTSSILYINETSADFVDNDYIFILDDYPIRDKLGKAVAGVLKHDFEISFRQLLPVIYNLKSAYVDWVDLVDDTYTIAFAPLALAPTSGATISTWAWNVADGTITVGSSSTQNITATFPQGFRWIYLTVTDSGSRSITRKIPVWAHGDTYPPQLLNAGQLNITNQVAAGFDATVSSFGVVDSLLDNTLVVAWNSDEIYPDATGSLTGDNVSFVGRIRKTTDSGKPDERSAIDFERQYTLEGPLTQLARIEQLPYEMLNITTPTKFGQIKNMTLWRGIVYLLSECSTFLELHSLSFDDTTNSYLAPTHNPVGNILNAVNDLGQSINAALQMNASGSAEIVIDARMRSLTQRALLIQHDWTMTDILDIQLDHAHVRTIGRLKSTGGAYNSVSNTYATYESLAPGVAQDYPEGTGQLDRQVLTANSAGAVAQLELNTRAGMAFERSQEVDTLQVTFPDGYYGVLIAALDMWHTFTVSDTELDIHLDNAVRWLLTDSTLNYDNETGAREVKTTFTRETIGKPGQTVVYPAISEVQMIDPVFPPFDPYPAYPIDPTDYLGDEPTTIPIDTSEQVPTNGNALVTWILLQLFVVVNILLSNTPGTRDVTPAGMTGESRDGRFGGGKDFYFLTYDSVTNKSTIWYTEDIFAGVVVWTSIEVDGEYTEMDTTATQGEVYIYGVLADACVETVEIGPTYTPAASLSFNGGTSEYTAQQTAPYTALGGDDYIIELKFPTGCCVFNYVSQSGWSDAGAVISIDWNDCDDVNHTLSNTDPAGLDGEAFKIVYFRSNTPFSIVFKLGGSSTDAFTRFSDDYATTFAAQRDIGVPFTPFAGIATSKIGSQILISAAGQTRKAATGSVYANYGSAHAQGAYFMPRYIFGSTSSGNTGSSPEYLLFAPALDSGASMWKVNTTGTVFTDITPIRSAAKGLAVGHRCTAMFWKSGSIILAVAEFGGSVRRLCVSVDTGATWTFSATLANTALSVSMRRSDLAMKQAWIANGSEIAYCANIQAATPLLIPKNIGVFDIIRGIEIYG